MGRVAVLGATACGVVLVAACNQAFGLAATELEDQQPVECPPIGTAPVFTTAPSRVIADRYLNYYQLDAARSFAIAVKSNAILEGPVDASELVPTLADTDLDHEVSVARLAPEGDELFVQVRDKVADTITIERYERDQGAWAHAGTLAITLADEFDRISAPTLRTAERRMVLLTRASAGFSKVVQELAEDAAGSWTTVGESYSPFALGVDGIFDPSLSADGLRLVFSGFGLSGENAVYYADRPSLDARFGQATPIISLIGNGLALSPFLDADCVGLYFYAVPGIHHVAR